MTYVMISSAIFWVLCLILNGEAIPCDSPRKPHPLDTHRFYYCINLFPPNGGHVWIPSKCHEGMIFSPILNMCVVTNADTTQDYFALQQQTGSFVSEKPSSFHSAIQKIDKHNHYLTIPIIKILDKGLCETEMYPNKNQSVSKVSTNSQSFSGDYINSSRFEENIKTDFSHHFSDKKKNQSANYGTDYVIHGIVTSPQELKPSDSKTSADIYTSNYVSQEVMNDLKNFSKEISSSSSPITNDNMDNVLTKKIGEPILDNKYLTYSENSFEEHDENSLGNNFKMYDALLSKTSNKIKTYPNIKDDTEVHHLIGHGNYYISVENYKSSILPLLKGGSLSVIPCSTGVRMPNITNCMNYYVCNATASTVHSYTCPPYTAFNYYKRICEARELKLCQAKMKAQSRGKLEDYENSAIINNENMKNKNSSHSLMTDLASSLTPTLSSCPSSGKFVDTTSKRHYLLCIRSHPSGVLKSYKMECPNNSEFCASESICKHRKMCLL